MVSTPLKNISQNGNLPQIGVKIKNVWNHHPVKYRYPHRWDPMPRQRAWFFLPSCLLAMTFCSFRSFNALGGHKWQWWHPWTEFSQGALVGLGGRWEKCCWVLLSAKLWNDLKILKNNLQTNTWDIIFLHVDLCLECLGKSIIMYNS